MGDDGVHDVLYKAMKGLGTDEDAIYKSLEAVDSQHEWASVQWDFREKYPDFCGGDLVKAIKDEMNDKEEAKCKEILAARNIEWDPQQVEDVLYKAMKGFGTDEDAVYAAIEQVATQDDWTNLQAAFASKYPKTCGGDLRAALKSELNEKEQNKVFEILTAKGVSWSGSRRASKASSLRGSRKGSVGAPAASAADPAATLRPQGTQKSLSAAAADASAAGGSRKGSVAASQQMAAQRTASRVSARSGAVTAAEAARVASGSQIAAAAAAAESARAESAAAASRRSSRADAVAAQPSHAALNATQPAASRHESQAQLASRHSSHQQLRQPSQHGMSVGQSQVRGASFSARAPSASMSPTAAPALSRKASTAVDASGTSPAVRERVRELEDLVASQDKDLRNAKTQIEELEATNRRLSDALDEREDELQRAQSAARLKAEKGTGKSAFFAALPEADKIRVLELTGAAQQGQFTGKQGEGKSAFFAALPEQVKVGALEKFNAEREDAHQREKQAKDDELAALRAQLKEHKAEKGTGKSAFFAGLAEQDKIRVLQLTGCTEPGQFTGRQGEGKSAFFAQLPDDAKAQALDKWQKERERGGATPPPRRGSDAASSARGAAAAAQQKEENRQLRAANDQLRMSAAQLESELQQTKVRLDRALDAIGASAGATFENEVKVQQARSCMTALLKAMETRQKSQERGSLAPSPAPGASPTAQQRSASVGMLGAQRAYAASPAVDGKSPPNLSPIRPVRPASPGVYSTTYGAGAGTALPAHRTAPPPACASYTVAPLPRTQYLS